ncbi:MAG TPA: glycosyltransferase family 4 protein [Candidatus Thermoplasmatota archaeon]|nr:glycosyltransferase family 4 protein [Candidatus Thermoplasmatota archaeon]
MRILVATPWEYPLGGGLERYAAMTTEHLAKRGHEVRTIGHGDAIEPAIRLSNTPLSRAIFAEARRALREERPDVVHVHTPVPGTAELVALAARKEGVPYVVTYHAGRLGAPRALAWAARAHEATFQRTMLRRAAARIAVSGYVAQNALRGLACEIIPPGVDAERFTPGGSPVAGRVLFVGSPARAYAWKGLAVLAEAVERLPDAHLRIVGDGDLAERYRARGHDVAGRVSDAQLVDEYRAASVVVLPSLTDAESFGMALAEANACGRPVVGSDVGGIPSFVRDGENGLLVPPGDVDALATAIRRLLRDGSLSRRLGERGRDVVLCHHRWDTLARRTESVLTMVAPQAR